VLADIVALTDEGPGISLYANVQRKYQDIGPGELGCIEI